MHPLKVFLIAAALLRAANASAVADAGFDGRARTQLPSAERTPETPNSSPTDERFWVVVRAENRAARNLAADAGMSIEGALLDRVSGVATPDALARLKAAGLDVLSAQPLGRFSMAFGFPPQDAAYHTYAQTMAALEDLAGQAPTVASVFSIGTSVQGREIKGLRLCADAKGTEQSRLPGVLFLGTLHAREHLSNETPLRLLQRLIDSRADPDVARLLATRDVYVIPMANPDGAEYDISGNRYLFHRKNMRANADGSIGVDLNRNWDWDWGKHGTSPNPKDDIYGGPRPFSEPETAALKDFIESRKNITTLVSYHTYSELILYPWGNTEKPIEDDAALKAYKAMAGEMGRMTGYTPLQSGEWYTASGDLADWSWGKHGIFSWTFELSPKITTDSGFYPGPTAIATTSQANWRPMLYLIDLADDPRRAGQIPPASL